MIVIIMDYSSDYFLDLIIWFIKLHSHNNREFKCLVLSHQNYSVYCNSRQWKTQISWTCTPKWNAAIINVVCYTCAYNAIIKYDIVCAESHDQHGMNQHKKVQGVHVMKEQKQQL